MGLLSGLRKQVQAYNVRAGERISTRYPTGTAANQMKGLGRVDDPLGQDKLVINTDVVRDTPAVFDHNASLVGTYNPVKTRARKPESRLDAFMDATVDNLLLLHDKMPEDVRAIAKQWYEGANRMAQRVADDNGITLEQAAGVMAALSPQKDWYQNASLGQRVAEIHTMARTGNYNRADSDHIQKAKEIYAKPDYAEDVDALSRLPYDQLSPEQKAMFVRSYDQAFNDRSFDIVSPAGGSMGTKMVPNPKRKKKGEPEMVPGTAAWGSNSEIAKAIAVLEDGSPENISRMMGGAHKVRNFYNNIVNPKSEAGDVTVDTHAVAAGLLKPLSGNSDEVAQNFGGGNKGALKSKSTNLTGAQGTYGFWADAYRKAAQERGILPREMQSITWEGVRGLFPREWKTGKNSAEVNRIWDEYSKGRITRDQARDYIFGLRGMDEPDWVQRSESGVLVPPSAQGDAGGLLKPDLPGYGSGPGGNTGGDLRNNPGRPTGSVDPRLAATLAGGTAAAAALSSEDAEAGPLGMAKAARRLSAESIQEQIRADFPDAEISLSDGPDDSLVLNKLVLPKEKRSQGLGGQVMRRLESFADQSGKLIVLTADGDFGGSKAGQKRFYKRHGFKENKGKTKDYRFQENMVREPQQLDMAKAARMARAREQGYTKDAYHGSTHDIDRFSTDRAQLDNDWGVGTYATTGVDDVNANYAGVGPDLTNRIERKQEEIADQFLDMSPDEIGSILEDFGLPADTWGIDPDAAVEAVARAELKGESEGVVYPLRVRAGKYAVIGGGRDATLLERKDYTEEARKTLDPDEYDSADDFEDAVQDEAFMLEDADPDSLPLRVKNAMLDAGVEDEYASDIMGRLFDDGAFDDGLLLTDLDAAIRKGLDTGVIDEDSGEMLSGGAVSSRVLEGLGYEGVIDRTVNDKFGTGRRFGQPMEGLEPGVEHVVTFPGYEKNVRSVNAKFDPENIGKNDLMGAATPGAMALAGAGAAGAMSADEMISQALNATDLPPEQAKFIERRAKRGSNRAIDYLKFLGSMGSATVGSMGAGADMMLSAVNPAMTVDEARRRAEQIQDAATYLPEDNVYLDQFSGGVENIMRAAEEAGIDTAVEQSFPAQIYEGLSDKQKLFIDGLMNLGL